MNHDYVWRQESARRQPNGVRRGSPPADLRLSEALLSPESALSLQRLAGNTALAKLIDEASQREPARPSGSAPVAIQRRYSGIAKAATVRTLQTSLGALAWPGSRDLRLTAMAKPALDALTEASVPLPAVEFGDPGPGLAALFAPREWKITVLQTPYDAVTATLDDMKDLASKLVHEARHTDQYYHAARLIYGLPGRERPPKSNRDTLLVNVPSKVRGTAYRNRIAAPSLFGKAKYRAALAGADALATDASLAPGRQRALHAAKKAIEGFTTELLQESAKRYLGGVGSGVGFRDPLELSAAEAWRLAKVTEGEKLKKDYRQALVDYTLTRAEADAFDIQERAKGGTFDAGAQADRLTEETFAQAKDTLAQLKATEHLTPTPTPTTPTTTTTPTTPPAPTAPPVTTAPTVTSTPTTPTPTTPTTTPTPTTTTVMPTPAPTTEPEPEPVQRHAIPEEIAELD